MQNKLKATEEQLAYAKVLDQGMKIGLVLITITFFVYVLGILDPHIPVGDLTKYWSMPAKKYLAATGIHTGWSWLGMVGKGDMLNLIGIAFLAGVTVVCFIPMIPIFLRKDDKVYALISVLEIMVLVLAASGVLKAGGH